MAESVVVTIWFWLDGAWEKIEDVLDDPPVVWEYGINDAGPSGSSGVNRVFDIYAG